MKLAPVPVLAIALLAPVAARADTMTAIKPGLMCSSPDALAKLTMLDGSSRASGPSAHPDDYITKTAGGCIDIPQGATVMLQSRRRNTSIVTFDAGQGSRVYVVPNVDFTDPISEAFATNVGRKLLLLTDHEKRGIRMVYQALAQNCPQQHWEEAAVYAYEDLLGEAMQALPKSQRAFITRRLDQTCEMGMGCVNSVEIGNLIMMGRLGAMVPAFCAVTPAPRPQ